MKRSIIAGVLGLGLVLASSTAVEAQLTNFPVYAVPSANGMPSSFLSVDFGRGLNEFSGEQNAFGVAYGRTGIADRVGINIGAAMVNYDPDAKYTFGGNVGFDLLAPDSDVQIGIQGGVGYISLADDVSSTTVPVGVAVKGTEGESLGWWFMPRLNYSRASAFGVSGSSTDFGASAGASFTSAGGFGVHGAIDLLAAGENIWHFGLGAHYVIG
jgi:hypothetical protein